MTSLLFIPALLLLLLPWLNPFAPGPSPPVVPWLIALAASGGLIGLASVRGRGLQAPDLRPFAKRWASPFAWALVLAGLASSAMGVLQFFGLAAPLEPWIRQGTFGEAFANLRQRNQFASLTNMALVALVWLAAQRRTAVASDRLSDRLSELLQTGCERFVLLAAALLAVGNAASSSRTGMLQLALLCGLGWLWGGWRHVALRRIALLVIAIYGVSTFALPWMAGLDPFDRGMFARLRDGDGLCESRRALWSNVLDLIALKPWLGWGWGELDYAHYITLFDSVRFCAILDNAHNLPLHLAVELGVPVAVLVCGGMLVWAWRRQPWREADPTRQMAWGVLAVIGLHSLLEYPLWYGPFQMAAAVGVGLLWHREKPAAGDKYVSNGTLADVILAQAAIVLIACSVYALWDYHRISQLYLAPQDRDAAYAEDTIGKARKSWLFSSQVQFAELTTTPLSRSNAQSTFDTASTLLHYSPEPRLIEKVIESAVMLGRDEEAMAHLARYRAAFPKEHAAWARGNARMPEVIESLTRSK
jgi:O-antigen ligase